MRRKVQWIRNLEVLVMVSQKGNAWRWGNATNGKERHSLARDQIGTDCFR